VTASAPIEETTPLAPADLLRGYANIAARVNHELPKLTAKLDEVHGISLAAHGLASEVKVRLEDLKARIEDVAAAVKAAPTSRSLPPPSERLEINFSPSKTGSHALVENAEIQRLQAKFAEKEALEKGAREYAAKLEKDEEQSRKREKASRERFLFVLVVIGTLASVVTYVVDHLEIHHSKIEVRP
jgi:hypothetical protein